MKSIDSESNLRKVYLIDMNLKDISFAEILKRMREGNNTGVKNVRMSELNIDDYFFVSEDDLDDSTELTLYRATNNPNSNNGVWGVDVVEVSLTQQKQ